MTRTPVPLRLAENPCATAAGEPSPRSPRWAGVALAACGSAALAVLVVTLVGADQRALRRLPAPERAALYQRTMENLTSVCVTEGKLSLHDFCRDQAEFALLFPECDRTCVATAREQLRTPTR